MDGSDDWAKSTVYAESRRERRLWTKDEYTSRELLFRGGIVYYDPWSNKM